MTTLFLTHEIGLEHITPEGHPERPDRLRAIWAALEHDNFAPLVRKQASRAADESVLLAHPQAFLDRVRGKIPETGLSIIDADTVASPRSFEAAMTAIGGALDAVDAVFEEEADNAFVAMRPPGHHAESNRAMGFCLFNQAAIAARYALDKHGAERVAIVDWDVHHGNGTQDIFYDDPSVIYCSTHQMPLYPGTGERGEVGAGNIVNAPLSTGDAGDHFREAFRTRVLPALENMRRT